eukprot:2375975-Rhodomonas_salina.1
MSSLSDPASQCAGSAWAREPERTVAAASDRDPARVDTSHPGRHGHGPGDRDCAGHEPEDEQGRAERRRDVGSFVLLGSAGVLRSAVPTYKYCIPA